MATPRVKTVSMEVKAYSKNDALDIARKANETYCQGKMSYFLAEQLAFDCWFVALAHSEEDALQAKDDYYEQEDQTHPTEIIHE